VRVDLVRQNRDQLFAEAVARHKAGEEHWLMPEAATRAEQEERYQGDPWLQDIEHIIKGESEVTTAHVAGKLNVPLERRDRVSEMRIGACLRFLGWERRRRRGRDGREYVYSLKGRDDRDDRDR
jgi:putative DNA primase/helicase